jgi:hypothetical protein
LRRYIDVGPLQMRAAPPTGRWSRQQVHRAATPPCSVAARTQTFPLSVSATV